MMMCAAPNRPIRLCSPSATAPTKPARNLPIGIAMLLSAKNVLKAMFVMGWCLCGWSQQPATVRETLPRDVTVAGIPGVIAPGAKWRQVWQGTDNADGIVGTADEGLLFAQEQPNTVRKLDKNDRDSIYVRDTHGTGALAIDSKGRIIAVERTCTDPGRISNTPCSELTTVGIIYQENA